MTSISKKVYIDKLNEYNNTYHRTIRIKPVDVKDNTDIDFKKEVNDKDPKFKIGNHIRISKYKNIFAKRYTPKKYSIKNTVPWRYVISNLKGEEVFMKKNYKDYSTRI